MFSGNAIHWQKSSQKHLQTRRWVNKKTHSALSKAGPRCAMEDVGHTKKAAIHLEGKLYYCPWWPGSRYWMETQANRMFSNQHLNLYRCAVRRPRLASALLQKLDFYDQKLAYLRPVCAHRETHHFSGTYWVFWNNPQWLVWSKW